MIVVSNFQKGVNSVLQLRNNTLKETKHCSLSCVFVLIDKIPELYSVVLYITMLNL